jgi:hypothetical protein
MFLKKLLNGTIFFTILLLHSGMYAADVLVYNFNVVTKGQEVSQGATDENATARLSTIFQNAFSSISNDSISYRAPGGQSSKKVSSTLRIIQNKVNALAVCFYYDAEYVLYGNIEIDSASKKYSTVIQVYSKTQNETVFDIKYSKQAKDETTYAGDLADIVNKQLVETIKSLPPTPSEQRIEDIQKKLSDAEKKKAEESKVEQKDERLLSFMEKLLDTVQKNETQNQTQTKEEKSESKKESTKLPDKFPNKVMSFYFGVGYPFMLTGAWMDLALPLVTVQAGPKLHFTLVDTNSFDFCIRPGLYVDYSVSMYKNAGYTDYFYIHSFGGSLGLDFYFEFNNIFGLALGGGGQYDFDVVTFREGVSKIWYSYMSYTSGAYGNLSLELVFGKEKNFVIGINNIVQFLFYNTMAINYRIMLTSTFKV